MNQETLKAKQELVNEIVAKAKDSQTVIVAEYRGLTVSEIQNLRRALRAEKASKLYAEVGANYNDVVLNPALQSSLKAAIAKFTAEEMITNLYWIPLSRQFVTIRMQSPSSTATEAFSTPARCFRTSCKSRTWYSPCQE